MNRSRYNDHVMFRPTGLFPATTKPLWWRSGVIAFGDHTGAVEVATATIPTGLARAKRHIRRATRRAFNSMLKG